MESFGVLISLRLYLQSVIPESLLNGISFTPSSAKRLYPEILVIWGRTFL